MAYFSNTIDSLGDDVVLQKIFDRSIEEFKDNKITSLRQYVFHSCVNLTTVDCPNVEIVRANCAFMKCSSLKYVNLPKLNANSANDIQSMFSSCNSLQEICLPSLKNGGYYMFQDCKALREIDLPVATFIHQGFCSGCSECVAVIVRSPTLCSLNSTNCFANTKIASGTGYIYVPRALVDSYKTATNWSTYATQFRALEDYTRDGTVLGEFQMYYIDYMLHGVVCSNNETSITKNYYATLVPQYSTSIREVVITMGGVDVTESVYNPDTGEIAIDLVTGNIVITATAQTTLSIVPFDGSAEGELPVTMLNVAAGQNVTIVYYLTKPQGYVYDGRKCGLTYNFSVVTNSETAVNISIPSSGQLFISGHSSNDASKIGQLATYAGDRLYGKYVDVYIT